MKIYGEAVISLAEEVLDALREGEEGGAGGGEGRIVERDGGGRIEAFKM